jgi:hypothetical protein
MYIEEPNTLFIIGCVLSLIGISMGLYITIKSFRSETETLKDTVVDIRHETEMTLLKNTKDDISPFLQLIKNENPKFTTAEGYFFFYLMNQIRKDLDRVQRDIMADVDDKIATHFSRINLIFGILTALLLGLFFININLFLKL